MFLQVKWKKKMLKDKYMDKKKFNFQLSLSVLTHNIPQIRVPTEKKIKSKTEAELLHLYLFRIQRNAKCSMGEILTTLWREQEREEKKKQTVDSTRQM